MTSGNKLAVYTAIFGGYDTVRDPIVHNRSADYWMVTEPSTKMESTVWQRYPTTVYDQDDLTPRMRSRWYKLHPHLMFPEADVTIWHGGNVQLNINPCCAVEEWLGDADIVLFKHPHRNNVYQEAQALLDMCKVSKQKIDKHVQFLHHIEYPVFDDELYACWFMIRRNNDRMRKFNEVWWEWLVNSDTERDQLCINPVLWSYSWDITIDFMPGDLLTSPHFKYNQHGG